MRLIYLKLTTLELLYTFSLIKYAVDNIVIGIDFKLYLKT